MLTCARMKLTWLSTCGNCHKCWEINAKTIEHIVGSIEGQTRKARHTLWMEHTAEERQFLSICSLAAEIPCLLNSILKYFI